MACRSPAGEGDRPLSSVAQGERLNNTKFEFPWNAFLELMGRFSI